MQILSGASAVRSCHYIGHCVQLQSALQLQQTFFDSTVAKMKVGGEKFAIDLHRTIICVGWNQSWYGLKPSDKMINKIRLPVS